MNLNPIFNLDTEEQETSYAGDFVDRISAMADVRRLLRRSMRAINAGFIRGPIELGILARGLEFVATQHSTFPDESDPSFGDASDLFTEGYSGCWPPGVELSESLGIDFEELNREAMGTFEKRLRNHSHVSVGSMNHGNQLATSKGAD